METGTPHNIVRLFSVQGGGIVILYALEQEWLDAQRHGTSVRVNAEVHGLIGAKRSKAVDVSTLSDLADQAYNDLFAAAERSRDALAKRYSDACRRVESLRTVAKRQEVLEDLQGRVGTAKLHECLQIEYYDGTCGDFKVISYDGYTA